ncbi:MAG: hypothetical protein ACLQNE_32495 [Thermoguttaceae bacterium]
MTQIVRFLLDECLLAGPAVHAQLAASLKLFGANAEIARFFDKFARGARDLDWIPELAREEGWIILTADRGMHSKTGEKLPEICSAFGVTHVMLSAALNQRSWYYKTLAIETHWEQLIAAALCLKGTGFTLSIAGERSFRFCKVSEPPLPPGAERQPPLFPPDA